MTRWRRCTSGAGCPIWSTRIVYSFPTTQDQPASQSRGTTVKLQANDFTIALDNGCTVFVCGYIGVDGLAGDLADGASFTTADGCTVTRFGDEALWTTPAKGGR